LSARDDPLRVIVIDDEPAIRSLLANPLKYLLTRRWTRRRLAARELQAGL
jgi:hypothetical protein